MLLSELEINKKTVNALNKKGFYTVNDIARCVPRKYKDYTKVVSLQQAQINEDNAVVGRVMKVEERGEYGRKCIVASLLCEESGQLFSVSWFGAYYMKNIVKALENERVVACGRLTHHATYGYQISGPDKFCLESEFKPGIMTIYSKFSGISEKTLKTLIYQCIKLSEEPISSEVTQGMMPYKQALYSVHYPKTFDDIQKGKERLLYTDLLYFSIELQKNTANKEDGFVFTEKEKTNAFVRSLPFPLTDDQLSTCRKLINQAAKGHRINELVQGDVGCGKTIVALTLMISAWENGYQAVLTAPTQVLAMQHFNELAQRTNQFMLADKTCFLHAGLKAKEKREILKGIKDGTYRLIVGTHSVFANDVEYQNLGLIITDEEHKFGVRQKEALKEKAETGVHVITMSATPIPKSLSDIRYGKNKEISTINSMPAGRIPIQTATQRFHENTFQFMEKQISMGHQCYVVCPAIESKADDEGAEDNKQTLRSVKEVVSEYEAHFAPLGVKVVAVHGKMKKAEIEETIDAFVRNEAQILISTTVIEVGVNVPNATVMVVEQAERFGLASLHQLRGRVGRGKDASYCILISDDKNNERLQTMCKTNNGFEIAEKDLEMRGGGELIGTRQSGFDKYVDEILSNPRIYERTQKDAEYCIEHGLCDNIVTLYKEHELAKTEKESA